MKAGPVEVAAALRAMGYSAGQAEALAADPINMPRCLANRQAGGLSTVPPVPTIRRTAGLGNIGRTGRKPSLDPALVADALQGPHRAPHGFVQAVADAHGVDRHVVADVRTRARSKAKTALRRELRRRGELVDGAAT